MSDFRRLLKQLIDDLHEFKVWVVPHGTKRDPPRFIAAIPDEVTFLAFQERAKLLQEQLDRDGTFLLWMPTFYNEAWASATLGINEAFSAELYPAGEDVLVDLPRPGKESQQDYDSWVLQVFQDLQEALPGFEGVIRPAMEVPSLGRNVVFKCEVPVSLRRASGRAFRLHAMTLDRQTTHKNIKVGVVVCRHVHQVHAALPKRKRSNAKKVLLELGKVQLCF